ncbi:MAG: ribosome-associated translation inhibitor RaiA [Candidatus Azambacteria bacterium]|nr:ribosome-associated translation inhibitor RaiA [Candidatus Azambacteria bacterium]
MKINLKTKNFEITPSIREYVQEKLDNLDKFLPKDESIFADVELGKTTEHHQKGDIFRVEINLTVPGRLIRAVAEESDLYAAIDVAKDGLQREITVNKEKKISLYRRGARLFKRLLRRG